MELVALMLTLTCDDRSGVRDLDGCWDLMQASILCIMCLYIVHADDTHAYDTRNIIK